MSTAARAILLTGLGLSSVLAVPACGRGEQAPTVVQRERAEPAGARETKPKPTPAPNPEPPPLALGEAGFTVSGDRFELGADGSVRISGATLGSFTRDARILGPEGQTLARFDHNGQVQVEDIRIGLVAGGANLQMPTTAEVVEIRFVGPDALHIAVKNADGSPIEGEDEQPPSAEIHGCTGELAKTCALALGLYGFAGYGPAKPAE